MKRNCRELPQPNIITRATASRLLPCLLLAIITGCVDGGDAALQSNALRTVWSGSVTVPLLAGKDTPVGTVTAAMEGERLVVEYAIDSPWVMLESHLDVQEDWQLIPQTRKHNPIPGRFAYKARHTPGVTSYVYEKEVSWSPGATLAIAAHAEVTRGSEAGGDTEGAWAAGTRFTERGNWATYFSFTPRAETVLDEGTGWQLVNVSGVTDDGQVYNENLYMFTGLRALAEIPLPASIRDELANDPELASTMFLLNEATLDEIRTSERIGELTPALQAIAEPEDSPLLPGDVETSSHCGTRTVTKGKTVDLAKPIPIKTFDVTKDGSVTATISVNGNTQGTATAEVNLGVKRFGLFRRCIPYSVKFQDLHAYGIATINYGLTVEGSLNVKKSWVEEVYKPNLFTFGFMIGPIPVIVGANLPINIGVDLDASASGSVSFNTPLRSQGSFDYRCGFSGCTGSNSFSSSTTPGTQPVTAGLSARIKLSPWLELAFRGYLYHDWFAYAQLAIRAYLHGDLWAYIGNNCGDADDDGVYEAVDSLTLDLDSELKLWVKAAALGEALETERDVWKKRVHQRFWDLIGSSALEPILNGPASVAANSAQEYLVKMRPCWPYGDSVDYQVDWGDGTSSSLSGGAKSWLPISHTWVQPGSKTLDLTALRDSHGRDLGEVTTRSVEVTGGSTPGSMPTTGLHLWFRADGGVTASGGRVSSWLDQSGNGRHAIMNTSARQPYLIDGVLNGKPVLRFFGAESLYLPTPARPTLFTVFIVGKNSKTTESFSMILGPGGSNPNNQLRWENGSQALFVGTGNNLPVVTSNIGNTRAYHALSARYDGSSMSVYRDGDLVSTHSFTTTGPWILSSVGAYYSSFFGVGDVAEIIIYDRVLSENERVAVNAYLEGKYNLP